MLHTRLTKTFPRLGQAWPRRGAAQRRGGSFNKTNLLKAPPRRFAPPLLVEEGKTLFPDFALLGQQCLIEEGKTLFLDFGVLGRHCLIEEVTYLTMSVKRTGGHAVVRALHELGARLVFSVSGNQVLPIFDAAADGGIRIVHMRHESASAFAAAGASELTGEPGVLLTSAGPAFLAALTGVATAKTMELPLLFLSGASPLRNAGFGNFQELDQSALTAGVCKRSFLVSTVESIPAILGQAWRLASSGIPGPVHVALPADVLMAAAAGPFQSAPPPESTESADVSGLEQVASLLAAAERPMIVLRPSAARGRAGVLANRLAAQLGVVPLVTGPPRALGDSRYIHVAPHYKRSDCALVIAPSDYALGFLDESIIASNGRLIVIDAAGDPPLRRIPAIHLKVSPPDALEYLAGAAARSACDPEWSRLWTSVPTPENPAPGGPGRMHPLHVASTIRKVLRPDDVLVVDGGEFCQWIRQGLGDVPNRWLWNSKFGIIGNSIPMALGVAALGHAGRTLAIMGDGGSAYHLAEFETAARYGLRFTAIVGNDARWGAEWHLQANRYGVDRTFETNLLPARYDQAAAGYGGRGYHVTDAGGLEQALEASFAAGEPSCINVEVQSLRSPSVPP